MDDHRDDVATRRWLGWFFALGAVVAAINAVVPGYGGFHVGGLLTMAAVSGIVGGALLAGRRPLPALAVHGLLATATAGVAVAIHLTQGVPNDSMLLYLWIALYAFYVLPSRQAWAHMAGIAVSFAVAIAWDPPGYSPIGHWCTVVAAIGAAGWFVGRLKRRLDGSLARLVDLANTDELTGLPNRRAWSARARVEANRARRYDEPLSVALIDLDGFKRFNDSHGHAAGDQLLADAAEAWRFTLRDFDLLARIGGDEFGVLLPGATRADAEEAAARLRRAMPVGAGCSVGTAQLLGGEALEHTIARADEALYAAKRGAAAAP